MSRAGLVNLAVNLAGGVNCQWSGAVLAHIQVGAESTHSGLIPLSVDPISIYTRGLLLLVTEGWTPSESSPHLLPSDYARSPSLTRWMPSPFTFAADALPACTPFLYARVDTTNYATNVSSCNSPCPQLEVLNDGITGPSYSKCASWILFSFV